MKNIIIIVLVAIVGILGYFQFIKDDSTVKSPSTNTSNSADNNQPSIPANGKTLDLGSKGLTQVSKDLLDNGSITTLDVSDNNLTGSLPAEIRKLTNLEVLNASNNKMTGIPAEIGQLSKLKVANFANNDLSGLPLEIGNLSNLETLDLRGNSRVSKADLSKIQSKIPNAKILTD